MPRPKNINPTTALKVYVSQENMARLALLTVSTATGRTVHGSISQIINAALDAFFKPQEVNPSCTPQKSKPESLNSEPPPNSAT